MFNTRNILIAVGAIIVIALIIYFVSKPKKAVIKINTTEGEVSLKVPDGKMGETEALIDLNKISMHTPLAVRTDEFPLRKGSKGDRVKRFQNFLQSEWRKLNPKADLYDFGYEKNGADSYWGNSTDALAYKFGVKNGTLSQDQYNILRINQFAKPE